MQGMNSARLRVPDVEELKQRLQRATFDRMTDRVVGSRLGVLATRGDFDQVRKRGVPNPPSIQELNAHGLGLSDSGLIVELSVPPRGTGIVTDKDPISALLKSPPKPVKRKHDPPEDSRKRPKPDSPRPDPTPVNDAINQNFEQQNHGQVPEPRPELTLADDGNTEHEDGLGKRPWHVEFRMVRKTNTAWLILQIQPEMATICVADCTFVIEKDVRCSYSDVFESMFTGELLEKKHKRSDSLTKTSLPSRSLCLSESEKTGIAEIIKLWRFGDERQCAAGFENAVLQALIDRAKRHPDRIEPTHILMAANVTTPGSSLWNLIIDLYVWQWQSPCLENFKDMQTPGKYPEHFLADVVEGYVRKFAPRMPCYHDRAPFNAGPAQYMNRARQHHGRGRI
ncbi:MAG: hypothetical protein L6R37_000137 [Teloschistes peruensis]|nr:MAG: hypothetical protein L6R37_000137 [Teloschistes peruensis]